MSVHGGGARMETREKNTIKAESALARSLAPLRASPSHPTLLARSLEARRSTFSPRARTVSVYTVFSDTLIQGHTVVNSVSGRRTLIVITNLCIRLRSFMIATWCVNTLLPSVLLIRI